MSSKPSRPSPSFPLPWLAALLLPLAALAAQRPLTHDDYDAWKSVRATTLSRDGTWVAYQIEPQSGDGELVVQQTVGDVVHRRARGQGARFSADGRFCVFTVVPSKVEERRKKIDQVLKNSSASARGARSGGEASTGGGPGGAGNAGSTGNPGGPGPGAGPGGGDEAAPRERGELAVLDLQTGAVSALGKVKGFTLSDAGAVLVYHREVAADEKGRGAAADAAAGAGPAEEPAAAAAEPAGAEPASTGEPTAAGARGRGGRGRGAAAPADPLAKKRSNGSALVVRDLATGGERTVADVVGYGLLPKDTWLWYHTSSKTPAADKVYGLFAVTLDGSAEVALVTGFADFAAFTADRDGRALAFTCTLKDFAAEQPRKDLWLWRGEGPARCIVDPGTAGLPMGMVLGDGLAFARDGGALLLSLQADEPPLPPMLADDKVVMDLFHWNDGDLQTAQQRRGQRPPQLRAVWHLDDERLVALDGSAGASVRFLLPDGSRALLGDGEPYRKLTSWDGRYEDTWIVNTVDGTRQKAIERLRGSVTSSPGGGWLVWFAAARWWAFEVATGQRRDLTGALPVAFDRRDDDHPEPDPAYGLAGFATGDRSVLLYDEFDVWEVTLATGAAVCVTDGLGRQEQLRLRIQRPPRARGADDDGGLEGALLLTAVDTETMAEGLYADALGAVQKPRKLLRLDERIGDLRRAEDAERWVFTRSTFAQCPDLWTADASFAAPRRLSDVNPQQRDVRWGRAQLVHWTNGDGVPLRGVLVVPDDFDPKRQYPLMVYFYERMAQNLHAYVAPAPGTSPNAAYYVSNGYLWFMPDVVYTQGYPGESCVKCVVAGVQHLIAEGFVDRKRIGAAGHSWGGYQTAYLATHTNLFAAVECGAAVCNMISAYGGLRYEAGVSRQFQYEQTQSRIGGTPWEFPLRYWENSPIFFADKVRTPVLLLHNDKDGAVPWTQGIEFYTALRRLSREAYLCNYVGEGHGLAKRQNQMDWSRRMAEFFDHHLRGAPMPKWMQDGVPFREREREKLPYAKSVAEVAAAKAAAATGSAGAEPAAAAAPSGDGSPVPVEAAATPTTTPPRSRPAAAPNGAPPAVPASAPKRLKGERIVRAAARPAPHRCG